MDLRKYITFILLLTLFTKVFPVTDSLVKFSELQFRTDFEKQTFIKYQLAGSKTDVIDLFLNSYTKETGFSSDKAHEQINDCIKECEKETKGMSQEKAIKSIYKYVHKRFFKKYNLKNSFSDVFESGEYNCVSGSAMYAIIFHLMDIPYQIIEAPKHVFLIAYPQTHKIFIETTIPENGYFTFSETYVQRYVYYMRDSKQISQEEYAVNSINDLFDKYYFLQKGLTIQELAGIQYANYCIYYSQKSDYEKASIEIKKAYFLSPNERNKYMLEDILKLTVGNGDYKSGQNVENLAILCRYNNLNKKEVTNQNIRNEFLRLEQSQLINQSNEELFTRSYTSIRPEIKDTTLLNEVDFIYHYELSRIGYNKLKDKTYEMEHLKGAYAANNKDSDLHQLILSYLSRQVELTGAVSLVTKLLEEFGANFDFLIEHAAFNSVKGNCLLELAYESLMMNEVTKGEKYISEFEALVSKDKDIKVSDRFVEKAYSTAATYYYKKGNTTKTKQFLKKGIEYAPDNFGLKMRLNQIH